MSAIIDTNAPSSRTPNNNTLQNTITYKNVVQTDVESFVSFTKKNVEIYPTSPLGRVRRG